MHNLTNNYDEAITEFCMMDDEFMTKIFEDNIPCTELLLRTTLQDDTIKVIKVATQKSLKNLQGHDIRLDILAKKRDGTLINVEVQNSDSGAIPQRARYHASLLDSHILLKGDDYKTLSDTYVIFITKNDVLKKNLALYHIQRIILEADESFGDGSHIIYVNNKIKDNTPLGRLMHDFSCKEPDDMYYDVLAKRAAYFKKTQEGREEMSDVMKKFAERLVHDNNIEIAKNLLADGVSIEIIANRFKLPIEEVRKLAEKRSA